MSGVKGLTDRNSNDFGNRETSVTLIQNAKGNHVPLGRFEEPSVPLRGGVCVLGVAEGNFVADVQIVDDGHCFVPAFVVIVSNNVVRCPDDNVIGLGCKSY